MGLLFDSFHYDMSGIQLRVIKTLIFGTFFVFSTIVLDYLCNFFSSFSIKFHLLRVFISIRLIVSQAFWNVTVKSLSQFFIVWAFDCSKI